MRRNHLQRKIEGVRKNLNANQSASYGITEEMLCEVEANRIVSSKDRHYILIKGKDLGVPTSQEESLEEETTRPNREEERDLAGEEEFLSVNVIDVSQEGREKDETAIVGSHIAVDDSSGSDLKVQEQITVSDDDDRTTCTVDLTDDHNAVASLIQSVSKPQIDLDSQANDSHSIVEVEPETITVTPIQSDNKEENATAAILQKTQQRLTLTSDIQYSQDNAPPLITTPSQSQALLIHTPVSVNETSSDSDGEFVDIRTSEAPRPSGPIVIETDETDRAIDEVQRLAQLPAGQAERALLEEVQEIGRKTVQMEKQAASVTNIMYKEAQVHVCVCVCVSTMYWCV